jgi:hypothetical protein
VNSAAGEDCDDQNNDPTDSCNACHFAVCGDNVVQANEVCDGNTDAGGHLCAADCSKFQICGDGVQDANEGCDDGDEITNACAYGVASCQVCGSACSMVSSTGNTCGDGVRDTANETCDDNNTDACGTCNTTCSTTITAAQATGTMVVVRGSLLRDNLDTFTLIDGFGNTVVFEYDSNGTVGAGHVAITFASGDSTSTMRNRTVTAINGATLGITATAGSSNGAINLANDVASSLGNQLITHTVGDDGFTVIGMSNGAARNCAAGVECASNSDCISGTCTSGACVGP